MRFVYAPLQYCWTFLGIARNLPCPLERCYPPGNCRFRRFSGRKILKKVGGCVMRLRVEAAFVATALACAIGGVYAQTPPAARPAPPQKTVPNFRPVTDAEMRAPKPEDWLMYRGNYHGWGYSALDPSTRATSRIYSLPGRAPCGRASTKSRQSSMTASCISAIPPM